MKLTLPVIMLKGIVLLPNNEIRIDLNNEMKSIIDKAMKFHNNKIKYQIYILNLKERTVKHILRSGWESVQERENLWINGISA